MTDDDYKLIFAKNLKYYLDINNKTQMDLINDLGLSSSTVSNWCTGLKLPRMNKIEMLSDYFNIRKSDLLEDDTKKHQLYEQKKHYQKEISNIINDTCDLLKQNGLTLDGNPVSPSTVKTIIDTLQVALELARKKQCQ